MRYVRYSIILMLAFALGACGHGGTPEDTADPGPAQADAQPQSAAKAPAATAAPTPDPAADAARPLQVDDLDAYAKGMQKEIEVRQAASDRAFKAKETKDETAELNALFELTSVEVTRAGAQAAGVDPARYDVIKTTVDRVLSTLDMNAMMAKMGDAAQAQKLQSDPYAALDPAVAAAMKSHGDELGKLRAQNLAILANAQKL